MEMSSGNINSCWLLTHNCTSSMLTVIVYCWLSWLQIVPHKMPDFSRVSESFTFSKGRWIIYWCLAFCVVENKPNVYWWMNRISLFKIIWKRPTLWWSVNLSDNWAFNVWTVNLIKTPTSIKIPKSIAIRCVCSGEVCVLWLAKSFTATHTPGDTTNHGHFTSCYLICMWILVRQDMLAN